MIKDSQRYDPAKRSSSLPEILKLGVQAFAVTGYCLFAIQLLRGTAQSEGPDKAIYLLSIAIAGSFLLLGLFRKTLASETPFYSLSAALIALFGIIGIEQHHIPNADNLPRIIWLGFGPWVALTTIIFTNYIFTILEWRTLSKKWKAAFALAFLTNLLLVAPSFWQSAKNLIDVYHSEYVINEILAPTTGRWPYSNFIPQYQSFYGFLLKPLTSSMDAAQISNLALIGLTIISFCTLALGVFAAWLALDKRSLLLAIGLVVPFTTLTPFPNREGYQGSIASLLSALPVRIFPGLLLLVLLIQTLKTYRERLIPSRFIALALIGLLSGVMVWQSQDFGIAAVATSFLVVAISGPSNWIDLKSLFSMSVGFLPGFATYPIAAKLSGHPVNFEYFLFFARQFGSGFGAERIRTPGPVIIILPLIVLLVVCHGIYLLKSKTDQSIDRDCFSNSLIGFSFSVWSFAGFTYYLNRSYASGQMQILFLSIAISLAALIGIFYKSPQIEIQKGSLLSIATRNKSDFISSLPIALIFSLPFGTLLLTPKPRIELARVIRSGSKTPRWPTTTITSSVADAKAAAAYAKENHLRIGFFGASAAFVEKDSGVQSLSILNSPNDLVMSQQTYRVSCEYIYKINPDVIVTSDEGAEYLQAQGKTLCNDYVQKDIPGVRSGHFAVRIPR